MLAGGAHEFSSARVIRNENRERDRFLLTAAEMHVLDVEISICARHQSQIMEYVPPSAAVTRASRGMAVRAWIVVKISRRRESKQRNTGGGSRRRARRRKSIATALVFIGLVMRHDHNFLRQ